MSRLPLTRQFCILCVGSLVLFGFAFGYVISVSLEQSLIKMAVEQTAAIVEQHVKAHFGPEDFTSPKTGNVYRRFTQKVRTIPVGTNIIRLTFWNPANVVVWADDKELLGKRFPDNEPLNGAFGGNTHTSISSASFLSRKYGTFTGPPGDFLEIYVPIIFEDNCHVSGVVEVYEDIRPLYSDLASLRRTVWAGVGTGFTVLFIFLYGLVSKASIRIERQSNDLKDLVIALTTSLTRALDAKSAWTKGHSERVGIYAELIAKKMGLPDREVSDIRLAGLLHDIGKIGTYDRLLEKPTPLSESEFEIIRKHPEEGARILGSVTQLKDILPLIEHHHERYDGTGYPHGLAGESIPLGARILHVADSFEAITDHRPYRRARRYDEALWEIKRNSGTQFDPKVVDAFLEALRELHGCEYPQLPETVSYFPKRLF